MVGHSNVLLKPDLPLTHAGLTLKWHARGQEYNTLQQLRPSRGADRPRTEIVLPCAGWLTWSRTKCRSTTGTARSVPTLWEASLAAHDSLRTTERPSHESQIQGKRYNLTSRTYWHAQQRQYKDYVEVQETVQQVIVPRLHAVEFGTGVWIEHVVRQDVPHGNHGLLIVEVINDHRWAHE